MSYKAVEAIWENGKIRWINADPPRERCRLIVLYADDRPKEANFAALFGELANLGAFQEIADPVEWQRELRTRGNRYA